MDDDCCAESMCGEDNMCTPCQWKPCDVNDEESDCCDGFVCLSSDDPMNTKGIDACKLCVNDGEGCWDKPCCDGLRCK